MPMRESDKHEEIGGFIFNVLSFVMVGLFFLFLVNRTSKSFTQVYSIPLL